MDVGAGGELRGRQQLFGRDVGEQARVSKLGVVAGSREDLAKPDRRQVDAA